MPTAFPKIPKIQYEGPQSKNPLAFKWYNPDEIVESKSLKEHLRFSVVYWHTMRGMGGDMFGVGTWQRPWEDGTNSMKMAETRVRVAFEFLQKLGAPFYAFHDRDVAPEGKSLSRVSSDSVPPCSAASTIPFDSTPMSVAGCRLATMTTFRPTRSAGS